MRFAFPFGALVAPRAYEVPESTSRVFLLGACPDALRVDWTPPPGYGRPALAVAVDNEPAPFWLGRDAHERVADWRAEYFDDRWGTVTTSGVNGAVGRELTRRWLAPLGHTWSDVFSTTCLITAHASKTTNVRMSVDYLTVSRDLGAPRSRMRRHPLEADVVSEALKHHRLRLTRQITATSPEIIVTVGQAASRVVAGLAGMSDAEGRLRLDDYGRERYVSIGGTIHRWHALVHPSTPKRWRERHLEWVQESAALAM